MFKLKTVLLSLSLSFFLVFPSLSFAQDETLTITTYYPSPYGSYNKFEVAADTWLAYSSGSVGIGTTGPGQKLEVVGNVLINSSVTDATGATPALNVFGAWMSIGDQGGTQTYSNGLGIKFHDAGVAHATQRFVSSSSRMDFCLSSNSSSVTCDATPTLSMLLNTGKVGIGTTGPATQLEVAGGLKLSGTATGLTNKILSITSAVSGPTPAGIYYDSIITDTSAAGTAQGVLFNPSFVTAGASAVTDISNLYVQAPTITKGTGASVTNAYSLYITGAPTAATNNYALYSVSGTNYFGGNVGIGTTPTTKFHIGGGGTFYHQGATYASLKGYELSDGGNSYRLTTGAAGENLELNVNDVSGRGIFIQTTTGNVGIGTTGPVGKLDIMGGSSTTTGGRFIADDNGNYSPRLRLYRWTGSASNYYPWHIVNSSGVMGALEFMTGANTTLGGETVGTKMIIDISGNVGIGTTSPGGKLDVNGTIYQRGSVLHADYVFEPSYELESIEEHSQYMWQNKHLKAVPKAQKDESGQDMVEYGARSRGTLEELEKAHVYIQQLNERIKVLEMKLSKLEIKQ